MTTQFILFVNIVAWAVIALMILRIVVMGFHASQTTRFHPDHPLTTLQGASIFRSLAWMFIAAAWLCAGRFA